MTGTLKWLNQHGAVLESDYPYTATEGECKINSGEYKSNGVKALSGCVSLSDSLRLGPVSVAVDATNW